MWILKAKENLACVINSESVPHGWHHFSNLPKKGVKDNMLYDSIWIAIHTPTRKGIVDNPGETKNDQNGKLCSMVPRDHRTCTSSERLLGRGPSRLAFPVRNLCRKLGTLRTPKTHSSRSIKYRTIFNACFPLRYHRGRKLIILIFFIFLGVVDLGGIVSWNDTLDFDR